MTSKQHHKHSKLTRAAYGNYCRNEWAMLGAPCSVIQSLARQIMEALSADYKAAYLDATHDEVDTERPRDSFIDYTSHPDKEVFHFNNKFNAFRFRQLFAEADYALVNGNHLQAKSQVIIVNEKKRASLQKRLAELTNVELIIKSDETEVFDFIKTSIPNWNVLPLFHISETEKIGSFFREKLKAAQPVLNGLVLAGGYSTRMDRDKTAIRWHEKEQRYHVADMISAYCNEVFISCRPDQQQGITEAYQTLPDSFAGLGPFGAILSAFRHNPDAAWLVIASDLPLLDGGTIQQLKMNRMPAAVATTFAGEDDLPEPLITVWEPKSYPLLLANLSQGYTCPRKLLINNHTHIIQANDRKALMNVNTPEQAEEVKALLEKKMIQS